MVAVSERVTINQIGNDLRNEGEGPRHLCMTSQDLQPTGCLSADEKHTSQQGLWTDAAAQVSLEVNGVLSPWERRTSLRHGSVPEQGSGLSEKRSSMPSGRKLPCRHSLPHIVWLEWVMESQALGVLWKRKQQLGIRALTPCPCRTWM